MSAGGPRIRCLKMPAARVRMPAIMNQIQRINWGLLDYAESLERMRQRHADRVADEVGDAIICVEHPRVFTLGKQGGRDNILLTDQELEEKGFSVYHVERGGDVTYHGPGQAVVYPVIDLRHLKIGVKALVEAVAGCIVDTAAHYGLESHYDPDNPGVWVSGRKLAAIGMAVPKKVSMHGLAMNVTTNLDDFALIRACGHEYPPTSLAQETGYSLDMDQVHTLLYQFLSQRLLDARGTLGGERR